MKAALFILFILPLGVFAQEPDTDSLGYEFRTYNTKPCSGCPKVKPGEKFPDTHPNAHRLNDTTLWEWKEGPYPGMKVYGLKPQYLDTLIRNDGSVIKVPIWMKDPDWGKPEEDL